ncbi:hypothetical protein ASE75_10375 [Sphingomonas sp. Leaf17]|nr:hypothetical protein ASE75_10375 [Sphingomonas sp. Leaf17]
MRILPIRILPLRIVVVVLLVLTLVPGWSGEERLALLGTRPSMTATRVVLDRRDPARTRVGGLTFQGGVILGSRDSGFGGFSALNVTGDRFTLLSDGGNIVQFHMGADWQPHGLAFANLPAGPGLGWEKRDRDSESMTVDPATGRIWVGFEGYNAIWRYAAGFARAERLAVSNAMARWPDNGGPESLVRLRDGRFVTISEEAHVSRKWWRGSDRDRLRTREGLVFAGDPTRDPQIAFRFAYVATGRFDPADMTELPNGDLLVLDRAFALPFRWSNTLSIVRRQDIRPNGVARGRRIATIAAPLINDNFEGVSVTQERGATMIWIVSDDNQLVLQRTLLLKFRLD